MSWESQLQALGCVGIAMILGAVLGAEREIAHKPAGLRTHMLISAASALLVALEDPIIWRFFTPATAAIVRADTLRILSAVITAVGFLGAGTIIRRANEDRVEGLTTAASMLMAAIIGLAAGLRQFPLAVGVTVLTLIALRGLLLVERKIRREMPPPLRKESS
jgi:putative Mg2+ transporter-C (MgtC) family protein